MNELIDNETTTTTTITTKLNDSDSNDVDPDTDDLSLVYFNYNDFDYYDLLINDSISIFSEDSPYLYKVHPRCKSSMISDKVEKDSNFGSVPFFKDLSILYNDTYQKNCNFVFFDKHYEQYKSNSILFISSSDHHHKNFHKLLTSYFSTPLHNNNNILHIDSNELYNSFPLFLKSIANTFKSIPIDFIVKYHLYNCELKLQHNQYIPEFILRDEHKRIIDDHNNILFIKVSVSLSSVLFDNYMKSFLKKNILIGDNHQDNSSNNDSKNSECKNSKNEEPVNISTKINKRKTSSKRRSGVFNNKVLSLSKANKFKDPWIEKSKGILKSKFVSIKDLSNKHKQQFN